MTITLRDAMDEAQQAKAFENLAKAQANPETAPKLRTLYDASRFGREPQINMAFGGLMAALRTQGVVVPILERQQLCQYVHHAASAGVAYESMLNSAPEATYTTTPNLSGEHPMADDSAEQGPAQAANPFRLMIDPNAVLDTLAVRQKAGGRIHRPLDMPTARAVNRPVAPVEAPQEAAAEAQKDAPAAPTLVRKTPRSAKPGATAAAAPAKQPIAQDNPSYTQPFGAALQALQQAVGTNQQVVLPKELDEHGRVSSMVSLAGCCAADMNLKRGIAAYRTHATDKRVTDADRCAMLGLIDARLRQLGMGEKAALATLGKIQQVASQELNR